MGNLFNGLWVIQHFPDYGETHQFIYPHFRSLLPFLRVLCVFAVKIYLYLDEVRTEKS